MKKFDSQATALTIAGSDPSGGAGLQADLKTFQQMGVYGMSVVTLLTVQNTTSVDSVEVLSPELVQNQLQSVLSDIPPKAIKLGALGNKEIVEVVSNLLEGSEIPLVVDPVLVSKHGHSLAGDDVVEAYRSKLLRLATIITPNRFEASRLSGIEITDDDSAHRALDALEYLGPVAIVLKRGVVGKEAEHLVSIRGERQRITVPKLDTKNLHGSGCVLAAAIAAKIAMGEEDIEEAIRFGIGMTHFAIRSGTKLGEGIPPVDVRYIQSTHRIDFLRSEVIEDQFEDADDENDESEH